MPADTHAALAALSLHQRRLNVLSGADALALLRAAQLVAASDPILNRSMQAYLDALMLVASVTLLAQGMAIADEARRAEGDDV